MIHSAPEATRNICHAKGSDAIFTATVCLWFEGFRNKDYSLQGGPSSSRSTYQIKGAYRKQPITMLVARLDVPNTLVVIP